MLLKELKCTLCGRRFECEVLEKEEKQERVLPWSPVRCPDCGSTYVTEVRVLRHLPRRAS